MRMKKEMKKCITQDMNSDHVQNLTLNKIGLQNNIGIPRNLENTSASIIQIRLYQSKEQDKQEQVTINILSST